MVSRLTRRTLRVPGVDAVVPLPVVTLLGAVALSRFIRVIITTLGVASPEVDGGAWAQAALAALMTVAYTLAADLGAHQAELRRSLELAEDGERGRFDSLSGLESRSPSAPCSPQSATASSEPTFATPLHASTRRLTRWPTELPPMEMGTLPWWSAYEAPALSATQESAVAEVLASHLGAGAPSETRLALRGIVVNGDARAAALRVLKARKFDVQAARALLDQTARWRAEREVDSILARVLPTETLDSLRRCLHDGFCGVCCDGFPVYISMGGRLDLASALEQHGLETIETYHIQVMEYCQRIYYPKVSALVGRTVDKVTLLLDLSGFGGHNVKAAFWEVCGALGRIDAGNYYEWLHRVIIVNGGLFFRMFWKTAQLGLEPATRAKFTVVSDPSQLERFIPLHQLPAHFGGTLEDEGCFCRKESPWTRHYRAMDAFVARTAQDGLGALFDNTSGEHEADRAPT
jgi:hypothetical protein